MRVADRFMMLEKLVKLRNFRTEPCDLTKNKFCLIFFFFKFFCQKNKCFTSSILYGTRVCGNVFKIDFRFLVREFEYVETFSGFALFLRENWV